MAKFGLDGKLDKNIILTDPIGYIDFMALTKNSELIVTDSGGIQEESTYMGVQCITVRNNTERPSTVDVGTNQLIGTDLEKVEKAALEVLGGKVKKGQVPELWDGKAAERITEIISKKI
jgi:UDP-N-acetylglucosamine 2-epimerase (non-hydrolysing)